MSARFLATVSFCLLFASAPIGGAEAEPWFRRVLLGMEVGPTGAHFGYSDTNDTRFAARFNGGEIVRRCVAAGSEYLVMWARDGDYAYYNSSFLPKAPGLGGRDPLREAVDEARKRQLPILAYCVAQQGGHFLKAHPEWEMRGFDEKPLGRFCFNSGYLEALKQMLAEQLAYGIDGFHIDMLDQGFGKPYGCWCGVCQAQFAKEFGAPMPKGAAWDEGWDHLLEFRYRTSERLMKALAAYIKSMNPRATVDFNYHGNPPFSHYVGQRPVQHAGLADFLTGETGVWGFSALTVGLNAEFYRAATPGGPFQVVMQRGVRMYHDQTTRPLADLRWELLNLLSHGAFVTIVDKTAFDGSLDDLAYERMGASFQDARARRQHFGQAPVQDVGIYFSSRTRDWVGREMPGDYFQSFQGAHKALVYEHIPWGVVLDENASLDSLQRFPVLLLPNVSIVSPREAGLFREYVKGGGNLIITGFTGTHGTRGEPLEDSPLSGLIGAKLAGRLTTLDNWMRFSADQKGLANGIRPNWPFLVKGPAVVWQPAGATAAGELLKPARTTRQLQGLEGTDWPMSAEQVAGPAMLINKVGQGTVLTFAGSPDAATASEHHIVEARRLLANAVGFLRPRPRVSIRAPSTVEAVVTDDPASRTLRVHLLGYNSPPQTTPARGRPSVQPMPIEEAPLFRVELEVTNQIRRVQAINPSTVIAQRAHRIEATVNDVHETLVLTY